MARLNMNPTMKLSGQPDSIKISVIKNYEVLYDTSKKGRVTTHQASIFIAGRLYTATSKCCKREALFALTKSVREAHEKGYVPEGFTTEVISQY